MCNKKCNRCKPTTLHQIADKVGNLTKQLDDTIKQANEFHQPALEDIAGGWISVDQFKEKYGDVEL